MEDQVRFMRRAIQLAVENVRFKRGGPFGAVVVKNGQIIAEGTNLVTATNDPTAHAEVMSIRQACAALKNFQLDGCDLYTSSEPCPMCLGAIYWARPARVFYGGTHKDAAAHGFDDSFIYQQMHLPVDQRQIPMKQLLGEEALEGFLEWRRSAEKVLY
jgi:guanine deaminase